MNPVAKFFAPTPDSIKGTVNQAELGKTLLGAVGVSSTLALVIAVLTAISSNAASIFPTPAVAGWVSTTCYVALDLIHRLNQGDPK